MLKKFLLSCATFVCCVAPFFSTQAQDPTFGGGSGIEDDPFQISSREHLVELSSAVNAGNNYKESYFKVMNDIDMTSGLAPDADSDFTPIGNRTLPFQGHFDGEGHVISNLYINLPNQNYVGLFGATNNGSISNLGIVNADITGYFDVGGLIGANDGSMISNCYAAGSVFGNDDCIGGLIGYNEGSVSDCYATGMVTGNGDVGGLIGQNYTSVSNCYAAGTVSGKRNQVGGLVGYNKSQISNCYVIGKIFGNDNCIGGLIGWNDVGSIVSNCYAAGTVSGKRNQVGGLVGYNRYGTISNCYAAGTVSGAAYVGGLIGANDGSTISNCYVIGKVFGNDGCIGGLIGYNGGSVSNCYAAGSVSGNYYVGGLIGQNYYGAVSNCYYDNDKCEIGGINGTDETGEAEGKSTSYMKSPNFVNDLNNAGDAFNVALNNYPALKGQPVNTVTLTNARFDGFGVDSGITTADYAPGMTDTIHGISPFADGEFVQWLGNTEVLDSYLNESTTFTMGNQPLSFTAQYKNPGETWYTVTAPPFVNPVYYRPNSPVTISMPEKEGFYVEWTATGVTLTLEQINQNPLTFTMPENNVTLNAKYTNTPMDPKTKSWIIAHYEKDTPEGITIDCLRLGEGVKSANLYRLGLNGAKEKKVGTFKQGKATYLIDADPNLVLNTEYTYELRVKKEITAKYATTFDVNVIRNISYAGEIVPIEAKNVLVGNTWKFDRAPTVKGWYTDSFGTKPKTKKISYKLTEKVSGSVDTVNVYTTASVPMFNAKEFKKRTDTAATWIAKNQDEIPVSYYVKNVNKALKYTKDYHTDMCDSFIAPHIDTVYNADGSVCATIDSKILTLHADSEDYKLTFEGYACGYSTPKAFIEYKDGGKFKQANLKVSAVMEKDATTKSKFVNKEGVSKFQVTIPAKKWSKKPLTDPSCLVISTGKGMLAIPVIIK